MSLFGQLGRAYFVNRLLRGGRHPGRYYGVLVLGALAGSGVRVRLASG